MPTKWEEYQNYLASRATNTEPLNKAEKKARRNRLLEGTFFIGFWLILAYLFMWMMVNS